MTDTESAIRRTSCRSLDRTWTRNYGPKCGASLAFACHVRASQLRDLARLYSIQTHYQDAAGKTKKASKDALVSALKMRIPEGIDLQAVPVTQHDGRSG